MSTRAFLISALIVILIGGATGYYLFGTQRSAPKPDQTMVAQTPAVETPAPPPAAPPPTPPAKEGTDYTAPGAPKVDIVEEKNPTMTTSAQPSKHKAKDDFLDNSGHDTEASQEGAPPPDTQTPTDQAAADQPRPDNPDATSAQAPTTELDDADFEKIDNHDASGNTSQPADSGKPQFRVQAAALTMQANAQALASALRRRGYKTSIRVEQDQNGKPVYKVQAGAYHSRAAADKAALALLKSGYPAYVSPINP
jgi:septal ring-binding cell division protein DamX